jgi:hypothetical protein
MMGAPSTGLLLLLLLELQLQQGHAQAEPLRTHVNQICIGLRSSLLATFACLLTCAISAA